MGKKWGFSSVIMISMMVALLTGSCAGKPGTAHVPGDEEEASRTLVEVSDYAEDSSAESSSSSSQPEETSIPSEVSQSDRQSESSAVSDESDELVSGDAQQQSETPPEESASQSDSTESVTAEESAQSEQQDTGGNDFVLWSPESDVLPESAPVDNSYFSDAVFVGDSRMQGFVLYSGLTDVQAYTSVGLTVDTAYSKAFVDLSGEKLTLASALEKTAAGFKRFYLLFGMNELGWGTWSVFVSKYGGLIDIIQKANPDAVIYLESLIPLTAEKSAQSEWLNNEHVNSFNQMIWQLAKDKGVYYLDTASGLAGEDGVLAAEDSTDGVHLNKDACVRWLEYLKTHTAGDFSS